MKTYSRRYVPSHPSATPQGHVYVHVLVAEQALGRRLPHGAEIHHVDGDTRNNARRNLVICHDRRYHKLLHARSTVVKAGGNPNTQKVCSACAQLKSLDEFNARRDHSSGRQSMCRECSRLAWRRYAGEVTKVA